MDWTWLQMAQIGSVVLSVALVLWFELCVWLPYKKGRKK